MKKKFILFIFSFYVFKIDAQIIRKNYLELTASEITDYNAALQLLWNSGSTAVNNHAWFAATHNSHFGTNIHMGGGGENFPSFHRFFLLHWELLLRNTASAYNYLYLPYWDWRTDPPKTLVTSVTNVSLPNFLAFSFLPITNFSTWTGLTRPTTFPPGTSASLPSITSYNNALSQTTFQIPAPSSGNFRAELEINNHNGPHGYVGGTMGSGSSPLDPIFFSHHAMVDKIWQDWEDQTTGIQSVFPTAPFPIPEYNIIPDGWIDDLDANACADSRSIPFRYTLVPVVTYDVWYAQNGKVILDGANGTDFLVNGSGKIYRYTTNGSPVLGGSMFIGDLYRDASDNILPDTKGGFSVPAGTTAHFRAGGDITLLPGASAYASSAGGEATFAIITTPNGF